MVGVPHGINRVGVSLSNSEIFWRKGGPKG